MSTTTTQVKAPRLRTMRAIVFDRELHLATVARPLPNEGEVLIRVRACAIARSDIEMARGQRRVPGREVVLGHEFVGEVVEATTPAGERWVGRRVVAYLHPGCTRCLKCRDQKFWLCEESVARSLGMGHVDGAMSEWIRVPVQSLVKVPEGVDDEEAVFVHPLASALTAANFVEGIPPQRVLVVGDGNMGLLMTLVLHAAGHTVTVLGRHPSRRELLWRSGISFSGVQEDRDAETVLNGADLASESYSTVVECTGRLSGFGLATSAVRPRGRIIMLSRHFGDQGFDLRPLAEREIELVGVQGGRLEEAVDYLDRKRIDTLPLVVGSYPLSEALSAFDKAKVRGTLKIILWPQANEMGGRV